MAIKNRARNGDPDQMRLSQAIYQGLRKEICSGTFKPGTPLSRRWIAHRFGASYTPVIEAMVRLEREGLVESQSFQVACVRKITAETIRSDYVLREAYETQAIRLACETATEAEIDQLARMAQEVDSRMCLRKSLRPETDAADNAGPLLHWEFHKRIAQVSGVDALVREMERGQVLRLLHENWFHSPLWSHPRNSHSQLVDAIKARDPVAADAVMRAHVRGGLEKELLAFRLKKAQNTEPLLSAVP